jgi:hypothetical protein
MKWKHAIAAAAAIPAVLLLAAGESAAWTRCERGHYYCTLGCGNQVNELACRNRCNAFAKTCLKTEGTRPEQGSKWPVASPSGTRFPDGGILDGGHSFATGGPAAIGSPLGTGGAPKAPAASGPIIR